MSLCSLWLYTLHFCEHTCFSSSIWCSRDHPFIRLLYQLRCICSLLWNLCDHLIDSSLESLTPMKTIMQCFKQSQTLFYSVLQQMTQCSFLLHKRIGCHNTHADKKIFHSSCRSLHHSRLLCWWERKACSDQSRYGASWVELCADGLSDHRLGVPRASLASGGRELRLHAVDSQKTLR